MQKLVRIAVITPIALVGLLLAATSVERQSCAQAPATPKQASLHAHATPKPQLTGTDGSQTGIAKVSRQLHRHHRSLWARSWLSLEEPVAPSVSSSPAPYSVNGSTFTYTPTGMTPNYERTLHTEAGLTTTADSVPSGDASIQPKASAHGQPPSSALPKPASTSTPASSTTS